MTLIRYPDPESVDEITARYLLSLPAALMPMLYGFRFDGHAIDAECAAVELGGERGAGEANPIHLRAADLRRLLGPGMFGLGVVFVVFADQLTDRPENRHIPEQVRAAAEQLPGADDLIVAAIADARGRQWWAVVGRHLMELDPVRIHLPAISPDRWRITAGLDVSLWTAALALDEANHPHLLRLRAASEP